MKSFSLHPEEMPRSILPQAEYEVESRHGVHDKEAVKQAPKKSRDDFAKRKQGFTNR